MRIASAAENHLQAPAVTSQQQQQPWMTPEVVLNHSLGPSSVETQAEVSLYIWIISLIRQFGTLYWLRIIGINDLWRVSNAFWKSTKTSDAVMFVTLQVLITHLSAITCSVDDLPALKPLRHWLSCWSIIGFNRLRSTLLKKLHLSMFSQFHIDYRVQLNCPSKLSKWLCFTSNSQESSSENSRPWSGGSACPWHIPPALWFSEHYSENRRCLEMCHYAMSIVLLESQSL